MLKVIQRKVLKGTHLLSHKKKYYPSSSPYSWSDSLHESLCVLISTSTPMSSHLCTVVHKHVKPCVAQCTSPSHWSSHLMPFISTCMNVHLTPYICPFSFEMLHQNVCTTVCYCMYFLAIPYLV